jgi:hypothetical protein
MDHLLGHFVLSSIIMTNMAPIGHIEKYGHEGWNFEEIWAMMVLLLLLIQNWQIKWF